MRLDQVRGLEPTAFRQGPDERAGAAWETARRRERIVRALLQNPGAYGARSEAVAAAATELDVTIQYLYRLIKVYEAAKHRAEREFHGNR